MTKEVCVVPIGPESSYALISNNRIVFVQNASDEQLLETKRDEESGPEIYLDDSPVKDVARLVLLPTMDCNLCCIYCYARGGWTQEYMTVDQARASIDYVRQTEDRADYLDLNFAGGGEPFLNFALIKEAVSYAHELFPRVGVSFVSNGTFNSEVKKWLFDLPDVRMRISFDGVMQDYQRPPVDSAFMSTERVKENIQGLVRQGMSVILQCVVTSEGLGMLRQTIELANDLGVEVVKLEPAIINEVSRGNRVSNQTRLGFEDRYRLFFAAVMRLLLRSEWGESNLL